MITHLDRDRAVPRPCASIGLPHLVLSLCLAVAAPSTATAQDLEPRRWTHFPEGTNTLALGYAGQNAEIFFNPLIGITDGTANLNAWLVRFGHTFSWSGRTTRIDGTLPYLSGLWQGLADNEPAQRSIRAGGDPWLRLSVNLMGAPSLDPEALQEYVAEHPVRTVVGASLAIGLPLGSYDARELINIGQNRYTLRPQFGVLHLRNQWSYELTGSVFLFSENPEFLEDIKLSQGPVWAIQGHVSRNFGSNAWASVGLAYAKGGTVELDRTRLDYKVDNILWNVALSYRLYPTQSISIGWQQGRTQVNVGTSSDSWLVSWLKVWNPRSS
jgi:hypothetical protein